MTSVASVEGGDRPRLFLALRLPGPFAESVAGWAATVLRGGRLVPLEHLHVTLAFLGRTDRQEIPGIVEELHLASAGVEAFPLVVEGWRETSSVGMLVLGDPTGRATTLATRLHTALEARGVYVRERRPWLPHVTALRFRERPRLAPSLPADRTFVPSDAAAYISHLHPTGARYEVLVSTPLGGLEG